MATCKRCLINLIEVKSLANSAKIRSTHTVFLKHFFNYHLPLQKFLFFNQKVEGCEPSLIKIGQLFLRRGVSIVFNVHFLFCNLLPLLKIWFFISREAKSLHLILCAKYGQRGQVVSKSILFGQFTDSKLTIDVPKSSGALYFSNHASIGLNSVLSEQVRPNDVWTCVACCYFIYKKLT